MTPPIYSVSTLNHGYFSERNRMLRILLELVLQLFTLATIKSKNRLMKKIRNTFQGYQDMRLSWIILHNLSSIRPPCPKKNVCINIFPANIAVYDYELNQYVIGIFPANIALYVIHVFVVLVLVVGRHIPKAGNSDYLDKNKLLHMAQLLHIPKSSWVIFTVYSFPFNVTYTLNS